MKGEDNMAWGKKGVVTPCADNRSAERKKGRQQQ